MVRNICALFASILMLSGCHNSDVTVSKGDFRDSVHYENFMMNVIMNSCNYLVPDYAREGELVFADNQYYGYKATKILQKKLAKDSVNGFTGYREIQDKKLGLTLRAHRWTCGCEVALPNTIIYVSDQKNFEYAFVLTDETKIVTDDTLSNKLHPTGPPSLEFQLNFLTNALKINSLQSTKEIEHFFALVADSLLCLKHLTSKDIGELQRERSEYYKENRRDTGCAVCVQGVDTKMNKMITEIKSGNDAILYCRSTSKYYPGFWRFEFAIKIGRIFINATFNKCICGKLHANVI